MRLKSLPCKRSNKCASLLFVAVGALAPAVHAQVPPSTTTEVAPPEPAIADPVAAPTVAEPVVEPPPPAPSEVPPEAPPEVPPAEVPLQGWDPQWKTTTTTTPPAVFPVRPPTAGPQLEGPRDGAPDCRVNAAVCVKNDLFAIWPRLRLRTGYEFVQADSQILTVGQNDGFFIDQTRIGLDGAFKDDLRFRLIVDVVTLLPGGAPNDPVQGISAAVRDAWVAWMPSDWFFLSVGQQFMPSDLEGSSTIAALPFARRSVATSGVKAGHGFAVNGLSPSRQMGLVFGSTEKAKIAGVGIEYLFAVANGNGQNILGNDNKLPAGYGRVGASLGDMVRVGVGGRHNPRTVGTLPNLFNEVENLGFVDATVKLLGISVSAQGMMKQTSFGTLFPDGGEGSDDVGVGVTGWIFADDPFGISLFGVIPAYRFSYYDPSSTFDDDQLIENTLGVRWDVPVDGLPLALFVDGTLLTEFGTNVRDLDNARVTALLQLEL